MWLVRLVASMVSASRFSWLAGRGEALALLGQVGRDDLVVKGIEDLHQLGLVSSVQLRRSVIDAHPARPSVTVTLEIRLWLIASDGSAIWTDAIGSATASSQGEAVALAWQSAQRAAVQAFVGGELEGADVSRVAEILAAMQRASSPLELEAAKVADRALWGSLGVRDHDVCRAAYRARMAELMGGRAAPSPAPVEAEQDPHHKAGPMPDWAGG